MAVDGFLEGVRRMPLPLQALFHGEWPEHAERAGMPAE